MILPVSPYSINNKQQFTAEKFRVPVKEIVYTIGGIRLWTKKCNLVREYSNPNAEQLYKQAKQTHDFREKARLYSEMGHYELVDMTLREKITQFLEHFLP